MRSAACSLQKASYEVAPGECCGLHVVLEASAY